MAGRERYQEEHDAAPGHPAQEAAPPSMLAEAQHQLGAARLQRKVQKRQAQRRDAADPAAQLTAQQRVHDQLLHDILQVEDGTAGRPSKEVTAADAAAHPERGPAADLRVSTALRAVLDDTQAARAAAEAATGTASFAAAVGCYAAQVERLRGAYLESPLYSTDDLSVRGGAPWKKLPGQRELLAQVSVAQLKGWQKDLGYVKFAVPTVPSPHRAVVGDMSHVELAQGPVVAAGLLLFRFHGSDRPTVGELENVSGGFRPGPLRNATAAAAIRAAGYQIADGARHDVDTGSYDHSQIAPDGNPRTP